MHLDNIAESLEAFGPRFLNRIFTPREIAFARAGGDDMVGRLAECFAAKEAAFKALGQPDAPLAWRAAEVLRSREGTRVVLSAHGVTLPVMLSHSTAFAFALVLGHD